MNTALINLGYNFLKLGYSLGQQLYLTLIYSSMAILWILELLLLYNLYNQSWTDFASRINDHLVVKWVIGIAFSIHYRPDDQRLLSLTTQVSCTHTLSRGATLPHCHHHQHDSQTGDDEALGPSTPCSPHSEAECPNPTCPPWGHWVLLGFADADSWSSHLLTLHSNIEAQFLCH